MFSNQTSTSLFRNHVIQVHTHTIWVHMNAFPGLTRGRFVPWQLVTVQRLLVGGACYQVWVLQDGRTLAIYINLLH